MSAKPLYRVLKTAIPCLALATAMVVLGLQAVSTDVKATPDLPGGVLMSDLRTPAGRGPASRTGVKDSPVVDMTTWEETLQSSPFRRR